MVSYFSVIGSLMCVMMCTRPDIIHACRVVSKYLSNLGKKTLECNEVDFEIPQGYFQNEFMVWK